MLLKKRVYLIPDLFVSREVYKSLEILGESPKYTPRRHFHRIYKIK